MYSILFLLFTIFYKGKLLYLPIWEKSKVQIYLLFREFIPCLSTLLKALKVAYNKY